MVQLPRFLERRYYGNPVADWLIALAVMAGVWVVLVLVRRLAIRRLERFAERTASPIDDVVLGALRRTSVAFLFAVALSAGLHAGLALSPNVEAVLDTGIRLAFLL